VRRWPFLGILVSSLLVLTACGASPQHEDSGWVGMAPYVDEESGLRGLMPMQGWSDEGQLVLGSAPVGLDELAAEVVKQTDLQELPRPWEPIPGALAPGIFAASNATCQILSRC
jgi:hypothetical protein